MPLHALTITGSQNRSHATGVWLVIARNSLNARPAHDCLPRRPMRSIASIARATARLSPKPSIRIFRKLPV